MPDIRSIFITGGAGGIGLATARLFAAKGWFVGVADIDEAAAARGASAIGSESAMAVKLDVRDREAWRSGLDRFVERAGRLDVLFNNAGIARYGFLEDIPPEDAEQIVAVNVTGVVNGAYAALPYLKATPGAVLVNMASAASLHGTPKLAVYSATKFAVRGLSEALDVEFERHGVKVRCLMPWFIETPMLDARDGAGNMSARDALKNQPIYTAEETAQAVWAAVHGRALHRTVGARATFLRWATRLAPRAVRALLKAQALG